MLKLKKIALLLLFVFVFSGLNAQIIINTINGKHIIADTFFVDNQAVYYTLTNNKIKRISSEGVYSIQTSNNSTIRFVYGDTTSSEITYNQMVDYMTGMLDAKSYSASPFASFGGFAVSFASPFAVGLLSSTAFAPLVSLGYLGIVGSTKLKDDNIGIPLDKRDNLYYCAGFRDAARTKRINKALLWCGIGLVAGFAVGISYSN